MQISSDQSIMSRICLIFISFSWLIDILYIISILFSLKNGAVGYPKSDLLFEVVVPFIGLFCKPVTIIGLYKRWSWTNIFTIIYLTIIIFIMIYSAILYLNYYNFQSERSVVVLFGVIFIFGISIFQHCGLVLLFIISTILQFKDYFQYHHNE